ncbi:3'(2'),5'-bisphosphate nucleotidase CysQ [Pseudohoeflea coraliihabitans]|uniref:3'(2'),5'-bisphosphate nucleotidase CysQ n=1 Tax=Pseudohoeflea coraliihabitans TaxID=2860393 RepID=A0ABS6WNV6_9HYPH|nr:3'(2'),5'-bisphosphate nucleotidase CysQ [Pseudohoeflea sp. DP4N28-3]MBW3097092.1 3'(2'),5'-bisphosphate nucleotidase CysQ [Pseudohoeflea sp. DP4N28-3]
MTNWHKDDLPLLLDVARQAGAIAHGYFGQQLKTWYKGQERSPVSEADYAVDKLLRDTLLGARPNYGWLSEETLDDPARLSNETIFVVDPIDGTRGFIAGKRDWCISVAIVHQGVPVAGVLAVPARDEIWAAALGQGATRNGVALEAAPSSPPVPLVVSMPDSLAPEAIARFGDDIERAPGGPSLALRIARVASGELDAVLVRPRSNEWDLAAANVLLGETGRCLVDEHGTRVTYNAADPSRGILVAAAPAETGRLLACFSTGDRSGPGH